MFITNHFLGKITICTKRTLKSENGALSQDIFRRIRKHKNYSNVQIVINIYVDYK